MSCYLRISGKRMDIEKLTKKMTLKPSDIFIKGQPLFKSKPNYKLHTTNEIIFLVSDDNFDKIDKQIKDSIKYLLKHKTQIRKLTLDKTVTYSVLDFGHDLRIGYNNIACQFDYFPHELLKLAGDLKINIASSLYPPAADEELQKILSKK